MMSFFCRKLVQLSKRYLRLKKDILRTSKWGGLKDDYTTDYLRLPFTCPPSGTSFNDNISTTKWKPNFFVHTTTLGWML